VKFGSLFSGIGAPEVAWSGIGWDPVVVRWIGERIEAVSDILEQQQEVCNE